MTFEEVLEFIKKYGAKLEEKYGKYEDKEKLILSSTVKLSEELGELCDEVLAHNSRQREEKMANRENDNLSNEFADVILATFMLAKDMDVNLEEAVKNKIAIIKEKNKMS